MTNANDAKNAALPDEPTPKLADTDMPEPTQEEALDAAEEHGASAFESEIADSERGAVIDEESISDDAENLNAAADSVEGNADAAEWNAPALGAETETERLEDQRTVRDADAPVPERTTVTIDETALESGDAAAPTADELGQTRNPNIAGVVDETIEGNGPGTAHIEAAEDNDAPFSDADNPAAAEEIREEEGGRPFDGAAAGEEPAAAPEEADEAAAASANDSADEASAGDTADATVTAATGVAVKKRHFAKIRDGWARYKNTKFYHVWEKRIKFSYGAYTVTAIVVLFMMNALQVWSADASAESMYRESPSFGYLTFFKFVIEQEALNMGGTAAIMNFFALVLVYAVLVFVINRFWVATGLFGLLCIVMGTANRIKLAVRNEPVLPSDLDFFSAGAGGSILSFIPENMQPLLHAAVFNAVFWVIICFVLQFVDKRRALIWCSWRHPIRNAKNIIGNIFRILAAVLSVVVIINYASGLADPDSKVREFTDEYGYSPKLWDVASDARSNGTLSTFLSLVKVNAMDTPDDYSKTAMTALYDKYAKEADAINEQRSSTLTDNTVIFVLSESFSDPTRVPGVSFSTDPIPYIRSLSDTASKGVMLAPTYGGGTANIEFMQMTGMSLTNFNASLLSPYQQLVPTRPQFYSFNQMWNEACGSDKCSIAYHPYYQSLYLRNVNYKKFGFSNLRTLDSAKDPLENTGHIDRNGLVSDEQSYQDVIDGLKSTSLDENQFIELLTIQNHMPYSDWYDNNQFKGDGDTSTGVTDDEKVAIETYAKGISYTDEATANFLNELNGIDKPITVVFYGDHLPGVYSSASANEDNDLLLHETDYFIWSNDATTSGVKQLPASDSAYTSPNYFMAQATQQLDAKVSPYLALLTELHEEVPALARIAVNQSQWDVSDDVTVLDSSGNVVPDNELSDKAKSLLKDYKLIQYDMACGNNYLEDMGFTSLNYKNQ